MNNPVIVYPGTDIGPVLVLNLMQGAMRDSYYPNTKLSIINKVWPDLCSNQRSTVVTQTTWPLEGLYELQQMSKSATKVLQSERS